MWMNGLDVFCGDDVQYITMKMTYSMFLFISSHDCNAVAMASLDKCIWYGLTRSNKIAYKQ